MPFASGGYHGLYYVAENSFGVTPANPVWIPFRHTDCSLELKRDSFESKELRSDRAITDLRLGTYKCDGDVGFELSAFAYDTMLEALLAGSWSANVLKQGVVQRSFSILRRFADITQYQVFSGCCPNKLTLDLKPSGIVTGKFSFIGSDMTAALPSGSTYAAAPDRPPMDSFSSTLLEGGTSFALASAISLTLENGIEADYVIGSKYAPQCSWGRSKLTGKLTAFFTDLTMFNKFLNETASSLEFVTSDGLQTLTWLMSNLKYTTATNAVKDEKPIPIDMSFSALHHVADTNLKITRSSATSVSESASPSASPSASSSPSFSPSASPSRSPSASPSASPSV
jgi:hypothetical protein